MITLRWSFTKKIKAGECHMSSISGSGAKPHFSYSNSSPTTSDEDFRRNTNESTGTDSQDEAFQSGTLSDQSNSLKQLSENPLNRVSSNGFTIAIKYSHPYYIRHSEWCQNVESRSIEISEAPSYRDTLDKCKNKLALSNAENRLTPFEQEHLSKIERANGVIVEAVSKPILNLQEIDGAISTIYENSYQLLVNPIREVLNYSKSTMRIYIYNQIEFRKELEKNLSNVSPHVH